MISRKNIARILRKKRQEKNKRIDEVYWTGSKEHQIAGIKKASLPPKSSLIPERASEASLVLMSLYNYDITFCHV
ncbi:hypothetical protein VCR14J2_410478 [Vibrio coralliirubri]|uniref:Uncharacterized protein n=1 Tax=Vibrio coralliirubri TaxID=1516159 RepID=A0A0T7DKP6_9VIBR|nr:hypothetical protein VCR4J2_250279 [Vibrio coralliirubri]CDT13889.1 hypothetical protein VCR1J2_200582 [Vibrio coralliirubri]CDT52773.1 hypothetical protein VCR29J2_360271 [Vibrio coralliirubri]CDT74409.1 hypothetical protein VCR8J2_190162 [Vibrio coralliirubri]CDT75900.1 hypothetical protein VCR26J2_370217 [Vibrio coralliirubri]